MLGLTPGRLRAYVRSGLLCPQRGHGGELRFSFQDILLLRTAEGLVTDRLPPRRVRNALRELRRRLPTERPLTGVHLATEGDQVVVRDGGASWQADSGQVLLSFDVDADLVAHRSAIAELRDTRRPSEASSAAAAPGPGGPTGHGMPGDIPGETDDSRHARGEPTAEDLYLLGCSLEEHAPEAARAAYFRALSLDPCHADAHVNLGRIMHEERELSLAEEHYRSALAVRPDDTTALFNLGVVLEDLGRPEAAVEVYEHVVAVDPRNADAHFNAARLHDVAGRYEAALRHLRDYRNLTSG